MPRKRDHEQDMEREMTRFFQAETTEAEARALDAAQRRERAASRKPPAKPLVPRFGPQSRMTVEQIQDNTPLQCEACYKWLNPPGRPNPGHQVTHYHGRGVSHGPCKECEVRRQMATAKHKGISRAEYLRRTEQGRRQAQAHTRASNERAAKRATTPQKPKGRGKR